MKVLGIVSEPLMMLGANYLLQRLNRLSDSDSNIRTVRTSNLPELELFNMEYCKTALGRLTIEGELYFLFDSNFCL